MARAALVVLALAALGLVGSGCGEEEGVEEGATVTAYVEAPLCAGATGQGAEVDAQRGSVKVQFVCLADPHGEGGVVLETVGANARRASEDSTTVAYLEARDPAVNRFSEPILEAAGIGWIIASSGEEAMRRLLPALASADSSSLRADVREALGQP